MPTRAGSGGSGRGGGGGGGGDGESYDATPPKELRTAQLKPKDQGGFAAAGALTLRRGHGGDPEVLVGMEHEGLKPLGGKRDYARETPLDVAAREFCEEVGHRAAIEQAAVTRRLASRF
jgi:8-oxo-dGTP pyrophosphatase MutT (NUDIX family)